MQDGPISDQREKAQVDPGYQLRIRAAWIYYVEGCTQNEVAKELGVTRITVTRLLSEARKRGEVVIRIKSDLGPLIDIQRQLEARYGLEQAIVAPFSNPKGDPTRVVAAAAGAHISAIMANDMTVGVGWGRTLHTTLPFIEGRSLENVRVISLLGGISQAKRFNPAEFAWQFAEMYDAEGFLIPAPALVDSAQTKHSLLELCGLDQILQMAESSDLAILSCGGISNLNTSYRVGHLTEEERKSLMAAGAVGDVLYNFIDKNGRMVDHAVNDRALSLSIERLARVRRKLLVSGGPDKRAVMHATLIALRPTTMITDEQTAKALLS